MNILFITQWFTPEPTFKGLTFAKALQERGHKVEVLTGFPNYPGGKIYVGYRQRVIQRENMDGVDVLRVPLYPSHDQSAARRIANYGSFALSAAIGGALRTSAADVMYVYHPPATVAFPAAIMRGLRRIPFVVDVQDLWPDTLRATGMINSGAVLAAVGQWCKWMYRLASRIAVLSPGFKQRLTERGVTANKIEVIYNWCDEEQLRRGTRDDALARDLGLAGRFNVVFAGTMGKAQALDSVLDAAKLVGATAPRVQFVLIGGGIEVERLQRRAQELGLTNVCFLARRPYAEIGSILQLADVLLVHLKDDPLFKITIPSKIQAYLAMGKPVIAAVRGDAAAVVEAAQAGIVCEPENAASLAAAVDTMQQVAPAGRERFGANGRQFYDREMSLAQGVRRFEEIFARAIVGNEAA